MAAELSYVSEPVFCFTSDTDWASEATVEATFELFEEFDVPLTPFVTGPSEVVRQRFAPDNLGRVGVHPNFLPQSTHGVNLVEVLETVRGFWPEAKGLRSHGFYDTSQLSLAARADGFAWDSNLCLFLQPGLVPLHHFSGLLRFPVFWEDDVHAYKQLGPDFSELVERFEAPGLKVINVHPAHMALNTRGVAGGARGVTDFVRELLEHVRQNGHRAVYLHDLYLEHEGERDLDLQRLEYVVPGHAGSADPPEAQTARYQGADTEARAALVREIYDTRDTSETYVTSRDVNLRELEIAFIAQRLDRGRVLDIGCGNGYTLISLAREHEGDMVGVDFSSAMVDAARELSRAAGEDFAARLSFETGDVRELPFPDGSFDVAISERCLLNLPSRDDQWRTIREVHRVLKTGGTYLMVEGTEDGLEALNDARGAVGLDPIPSVSEDNFSSLKFDETELRAFLEDMFTIEEVRYFGAYYLISRIIQPLLALPNGPSFTAAMNERGRAIELATDGGSAPIGHVVGYRLTARSLSKADDV